MRRVRGIHTSDVLIPAEKGKQGPGEPVEGEYGQRRGGGGVVVIPNKNKQPQTHLVNITHFLSTCSYDTD